MIFLIFYGIKRRRASPGRGAGPAWRGGGKYPAADREILFRAGGIFASSSPKSMSSCPNSQKPPDLEISNQSMPTTSSRFTSVSR